MIESNPFAPYLPAGFEILPADAQDFLSDQTDNLRQVHDKNQAGDSTFPADLLFALSTQVQFTLGSTGRFYHETYGLIQARYVQFSQMSTGPLGAPVGLISGLESYWQATNDFSASNTRLILGLLCSDRIPQRGEYGWVLQVGANLYDVATTAAFEAFERATWTESGKIAPEDGTAFAVVLHDSSGDSYPAGSLFVNAYTCSDYSRISVGSLNQRLLSLEQTVTGQGGLLGAMADFESNVTAQLTQGDAQIAFISQRLSNMSADNANVSAQIQQNLTLTTRYMNSALGAANSAGQSASDSYTNLMAGAQQLSQVQAMRDSTGEYVNAAISFSAKSKAYSESSAGFSEASASFSLEAQSYRDAAGNYASEAHSDLELITTMIDDFNLTGYVTQAVFDEEHTVRVNAETALSTSITTLSTTLGGVSAQTTVNTGAITTLDNKNQAWWKVETVAGGRAQLSVYADAVGGHIDMVGDVRIDGSLTVNGSIYADSKLTPLSVTTQVIQTNAITNSTVYKNKSAQAVYPASGNAADTVFMSAVITTEGYKVTLTFSAFYNVAYGSGQTAYIVVYRDGIGGNGSASPYYVEDTFINQWYGALTYFFIDDSCPAGTHTYYVTLQGAYLAGSSVNSRSMLIQEFKK